MKEGLIRVRGMWRARGRTKTIQFIILALLLHAGGAALARRRQASSPA